MHVHTLTWKKDRLFVWRKNIFYAEGNQGDWSLRSEWLQVGAYKPAIGRHAKELLDISWNNFYNAEIIFFLLSFNITEIWITIKLIYIYTEEISKKYVYILQDYTALWKFCYTRITDHIMALYKYNR